MLFRAIRQTALHRILAKIEDGVSLANRRDFGKLAGMGPQIFSHLQVHAVQFGQKTAGRQAIILRIRFSFAKIINLLLKVGILSKVVLYPFSL